MWCKTLAMECRGDRVAHLVRITDLIGVGKNDVWPGETSDHFQ